MNLNLIKYFPLVPAFLLVGGCASLPGLSSAPQSPVVEVRVPVLDPQDVVAGQASGNNGADTGVVDLVLQESWPIPNDWRRAALEEAWVDPLSTERHRALANQILLRVPEAILPERFLAPESLTDVSIPLQIIDVEAVDGMPEEGLEPAVTAPVTEIMPPPAAIAAPPGPIVPVVPVIPATEALDSTDTQNIVAALDPLHDVHYDLPVEVNEAVLMYLEYFQTRMRPTFSRYLIRSGRYIPMMQEVFRKYGLPEDLVYISMIESGFNPYAYSRARASGPWQFIAATGKRYGLRQDYWVDERRNALLATHAAARYFTDLHARFGDWFLAMASYNAGEGQVARALKRTGAHNFWELREAYALPQETRDYVPKFLAAAIIAKNPEEYGFFIEPHARLNVKTVALDGPTSLSALAKAAEVPVDEIKFLNPQLRRGLTPPDKKPYQVAIPAAKVSLFAANFERIKQEESELWAQKARSMGSGYLVRHRVRSGESLSTIAKKYGSRVSRIQRANNMGKKTVIRVGKTLLVPTGKKYKKAAPAQVKYRVKRGDSLWKIANRYKVRVKDLLVWNGLKSSSVLRPGDQLVVKIKGS